MITAFYAAILAIIFVFLSVRTLLTRRREKIAIGHGENKALLRAMRVHANFSEYVPISLILIFFLEYLQSKPILIHFLCITLLLGRIIHAIGLSRVPENFRYRVIGMALTFTTILSAAICILFLVAGRSAY